MSESSIITILCSVIGALATIFAAHMTIRASRSPAQASASVQNDASLPASEATAASLPFHFSCLLLGLAGFPFSIFWREIVFLHLLAFMPRDYNWPIYIYIGGGWVITTCIAAAVALDLRKRLTGADIALLWLACAPGAWSDIGYSGPLMSVAPILPLLSVLPLTVFRWHSVGAIELAVYWFGCAILNLLPAIFRGPNVITEGANVWEAVLLAVVATCLFGLWWALQQSKGRAA